MSITDRLASSLSRNDEEPNILVAQQIVKNKDADGVKELINNIKSASKAIRHDSIKVLYEVGDRKPELIANYTNVFIDLLVSKDNRMQWGAMTCLASIAKVNPAELYKHIDMLEKAANVGSVITRDNYIRLLVNIARVTECYDEATQKILMQLLSAPENQLPMYAEMVKDAFQPNDTKQFTEVLKERLSKISKESRIKRIQKVINLAA
ncbi:DUF1617 family protein [Candidatus Saccharibacteria bacterium]|nr:DUF1617 family protein [Candidatus Saccharibacteria bacterium]MCB9821082.1 DUF1617 family protein [Candidatus Nomurabacteria bacterium]